MTANNGERFDSMCQSLDNIIESYRIHRPHQGKSQDNPPDDYQSNYYYDLSKHLEWLINKHWCKLGGDEGLTLLTSTGLHSHKVFPKGDKDGRITMPKPIRDALANANQPWNQEKVTITWLVCYINNIWVDTDIVYWQFHDCSHRCINKSLINGNVAKLEHARYPGVTVPHGFLCIDPKCLVWESKPSNQSRGNEFCFKPCEHEGCVQGMNSYTCLCSKLHNPPCL